MALTSCAAKTSAPAEAPWSLTIVETEAGELCAASGDGCRPAAPGPQPAKDLLLRTTDAGRLSATLDEETSAELGPGASVLLVDGNPRLIEVKSGVVVVSRAPRSGGATAARLSVKIGDQIADLDPRAPTVMAVKARAGGDRAVASVEHGVVTFRHGTDATIELRSGETAALVKDKGVDRRAELAGEVSRVEKPLREERPAGGPVRGLGTMTARVPGTEEVVAGVRLASHHVRAVVQRGFARTEIEEVFANDTDRTLEGRYVFAVPPRAVTARLALWVGEKLVEDEIVERARAAAIFKGIVDDTVRPRDPALLEWVASGELSLKVFPIPPRGSRKVVLAYDEAIASGGGEARYVLPLSLGASRANTIDDLSISVVAADPDGPPEDVTTPRYATKLAREGNKITATYEAKGASPANDFVVSWRPAKPASIDATAFVPAWGGAGELGIDRTVKAAGEQAYFALRIPVGTLALDKTPAFRRRDRAIVLDTSQSQSKETLDAEIALASAMIREMEPDENFVLLACDSACATYPEKDLAPAIGASFEAADAWVKKLSPAGSSDIAGALVAASSRLPDAGGGQVVYVGDGIASSGELGIMHVAARAKPAVERKKADVRLIGAGVTVDAASLSSLAHELGAAYQPLVTGEPVSRRIDHLAASLRMPVVRNARVELPAGMTDVYPSTLPNLVLDDEVMLVGKLAKAEDTTIKISGELEGAQISAEGRATWGSGPDRQAALVPRLWAARRIDDLVASGDVAAKKESIELSKRFHILSRYTSMLVLENDAMFAEMGVKRTIPADGSVPGRTQGAALQMQLDAMSMGVLGGLGAPGGAPSLDAAKTGSGTSASDLKISGSGPSTQRGGLAGIGSVDGIGTGTAGMSTVRPPRAIVTSTGSVSAGKIAGFDRVIAGSRGRARSCYSRGLATDPDMQGVLRFTMIIGAGGEVSSANVTLSGHLASSVAACVSSVLRNLQFDAPEGGRATAMGSFTMKSEPGDNQSFNPPSGLRSMPALPAGPSASHRASDDAWRTQGDDALAKLRAALDKSPESRKKREELIRGLLSHGRFDEAITLARAFVTMDPDSPAARELLSYGAASMGETKEALLAVDASVETAPLLTKGHLRAARAFEAAGDETRACAHWRALADIEATDERLYESLRCRARALGERDAVLAEAKAIAKPGKLVEKLLPLLEANTVPAYDGSSSAMGQMEVIVTCAASVTSCPVPLIVAPNGTIFSPMTPADARSGKNAVAVTVLRDGAYHTMLLGGAPDASGTVSVRAAGITQSFPFAHGGLQSVAATQISVPPAFFGLGSLLGVGGGGGSFGW